MKKYNLVVFSDENLELEVIISLLMSFFNMKGDEI